VITFFAFEQVRNNEFVDYDDNEYITRNPDVQAGLTQESLAWAFNIGYSGNWHPLTWMSHMLDCQLYGLNPGAHHMTSLLLHIANTLLLFWILLRMTGRLGCSVFVAALFAIHPLHVDSVAWAAERKDILSGFFWMLTIAAYLRYVQKTGFIRYLAVILTFSLGLMSKPMIVTLPFVLLLLDYWPLNRLMPTQELEYANKNSHKSATASVFIEKIPLFILVLISAIITFVAQQRRGAVVQTHLLPISVRAGNAVVSYIGYIIKMFWPHHLAVLYPHPLGTIPAWKVTAAVLVLAAVTVAVIFAARRHAPLRWLPVGWFWYLGTLVPVIGLVQVGDQAMADRYTYLPAIGIFIIVAWCAAEFLPRWRYGRIILQTLAVAVLAILLVCTRMQVKHWQNDIALFGHAVDVTENNYVMHKTYGSALLKQGKVDDAFEQFTEALRINPRYCDARVYLGMVLFAQNKLDRARDVFKQVLAEKPDSHFAYYGLGRFYSEKSEYALAAQNYKQALLYKSDYLEAHYYLAIALIQLGRFDESVKHLNTVLQAQFERIRAHHYLGQIYTYQQKYEQAIRHLQEVIQAGKQWPDAYNNYGVALKALGKNDQAVIMWQKALEIKPDHAQAKENLSRVMKNTE